METVSNIVDRLLDEEKAEIAEKLFRAYVNGSFTWENYVHLCFCLEMLNPAGYNGFKEVYHSKKPKDKKDEEKKHTKVFSLGATAPYYESALVSAGLATRNWSELTLNKYGVLLYEFGF